MSILMDIEAAELDNQDRSFIFYCMLYNNLYTQMWRLPRWVYWRR